MVGHQLLKICAVMVLSVSGVGCDGTTLSITSADEVDADQDSSAVVTQPVGVAIIESPALLDSDAADESSPGDGVVVDTTGIPSSTELDALVDRGVRACSFAIPDLDGDGWGWENGATCLFPDSQHTPDDLASNSSRALKIMAMGDSITSGYNSCSYRTPLVQELQDYAVEFVGKKEKTIGSSSGCIDSNFEHEGRSGWRTIDWLAMTGGGEPGAIAFVRAERPDIVLLHIGSNDLFRGEYPGTFDSLTGTGTYTIGRISQMIDMIYIGSPGVTIYVADVIPWFADAEIVKKMEDLRVELSAMTSYRQNKGEKVKLVNVSEQFTPGMMQADLIHPNNVGDAYLATKWLSAMREDGFLLAEGDTSRVRREAESGILSGNMQIKLDVSASGGYAVSTESLSEYQADYVSIDFDVTNTGVYKVLGSVSTDSGSDGGTLLFQVATGDIHRWGVPASVGYATDYVRAQNRIYVYLARGTHTVKVYSRSADVSLDWLELQFVGDDPDGDVDLDWVPNRADLFPNDSTRFARK